MNTHEELKIKAIEEIEDILHRAGLNTHCTVNYDGALVDLDETDGEYMSVQIRIIFEAGKNKHIINLEVGYRVEDGDIGLGYGEDCQTQRISASSLLATMFFGVAAPDVCD